MRDITRNFTVSLLQRLQKKIVEIGDLHRLFKALKITQIGCVLSSNVDVSSKYNFNRGSHVVECGSISFLGRWLTCEFYRLDRCCFTS